MVRSIVVLQGLAHTLAWMVSTVNRKGWAAVSTGLATPELLYGMIVSTFFPLHVLHLHFRLLVHSL